MDYDIEMQTALEILRLLFFPGLLFMALCGRAVIYGEERLGAALYGGEAEPFLPAMGERSEAAASPAELVLLALSLSGMAAAGVMLVGMRGDLLALALIFPAAELLPLCLEAGGGVESLAFLPLAFRTRLARVAVVACVAVGVSLRFPGEFAPDLRLFAGEGSFSALKLWGGADYGLMLASLLAATAALLASVASSPGPAGARAQGGEGTTRAGFLYLAGGMERAVSILVFVVLFLGYPWEGWLGIVEWSAAALGTALAVTAFRAWAGGRDAATLRRWQEAGFLAAVLSLVLALAAAA